jgi:hypothetical protein
MSNILSLNAFKKFGMLYMAYEAVSLITFLAFGAHFTSLM